MADLHQFSGFFSTGTQPYLAESEDPGDIIGGALVRAQGCRCNCGRTAAVSFGSVFVDYDDGLVAFSDTYTLVDFFAWLDAGRPSLDPSTYVAWLDFMEADSGCGSSVGAFFGRPSSISESGLGILEVTDAGAGTCSMWNWDGSQWSADPAFERTGVLYSSAIGRYASGTEYVDIESQQLLSWRRRIDIPFPLTFPP